MAVHAFVEFEMPEAEVFADLTGIRYDLESTRSLARRLQREMEGNKPDYGIVDVNHCNLLYRIRK